MAATFDARISNVFQSVPIGPGSCQRLLLRKLHEYPRHIVGANLSGKFGSHAGARSWYLERKQLGSSVAAFAIAVSGDVPLCGGSFRNDGAARIFHRCSTHLGIRLDVRFSGRIGVSRDITRFEHSRGLTRVPPTENRPKRDQLLE